MRLRKYKVYFKIFDKKMVTTVEASNRTEASMKVKNKVEILFVKPIENEIDNSFFNDLFSYFRK